MSRAFRLKVFSLVYLESFVCNIPCGPNKMRNKDDYHFKHRSAFGSALYNQKHNWAHNLDTALH